MDSKYVHSKYVTDSINLRKTIGVAIIKKVIDEDEIAEMNESV